MSFFNFKSLLSTYSSQFCKSLKPSMNDNNYKYYLFKESPYTYTHVCYTIITAHSYRQFGTIIFIFYNWNVTFSQVCMVQISECMSSQTKIQISYILIIWIFCDIPHNEDWLNCPRGTTATKKCYYTRFYNQVMHIKEK